MLLVWVPSRAHIFDLVFAAPPTGADIRKSAIITNIGVRETLVIDTVYNSCTLFLVEERGLAVIQQRFDLETKATFWTEVDDWLTDPLYLHPGFRAYFDSRAAKGTDGLYPTVTIRQIMWALKMKPLPKQPWETVFDHAPI